MFCVLVLKHICLLEGRWAWSHFLGYRYEFFFYSWRNCWQFQIDFLLLLLKILLPTCHYHKVPLLFSFIVWHMSIKKGLDLRLPPKTWSMLLHSHNQLLKSTSYFSSQVAFTLWIPKIGMKKKNCGEIKGENSTWLYKYLYWVQEVLKAIKLASKMPILS
jgi:hypothetical protein